MIFGGFLKRGELKPTNSEKKTVPPSGVSDGDVLAPCVLQVAQVPGLETVPVLAHLVHCMGEPCRCQLGRLHPRLDDLRRLAMARKQFADDLPLVVEHCHFRWQTGRFLESNWSVLLVMKTHG